MKVALRLEFRLVRGVVPALWQDYFEVELSSLQTLKPALAATGDAIVRPLGAVGPGISLEVKLLHLVSCHLNLKLMNGCWRTCLRPHRTWGLNAGCFGEAHSPAETGGVCEKFAFCFEKGWPS